MHACMHTYIRTYMRTYIRTLLRLPYTTAPLYNGSLIQRLPYTTAPLYNGSLIQRLPYTTTSGRKTRALGATISGMCHRCRLRSKTGWVEFGCLLCYFNLVPRAHVPFGQHQDTELWNNQQARSQSPRIFCF